MGNKPITSQKEMCFTSNKQSQVQNTNSLVILTSPHSKCDNESQVRMCDTNAEAARLSLNKLLTKEGFKVKEFEADVYRSEQDLNRFPARQTTFRTAIRSFIEQNKDQILYLLDIHSFPQGYQGFGQDTQVCLLDDTVFLSQTNDPRYPIYPFCKETLLLEQMLRDKGIHTSAMEGSINDLQNESRIDQGIPTLLIEYREDLEIHTLDQINSIITQWMSILKTSF
jgi:hypothetical protein